MPMTKLNLRSPAAYAAGYADEPLDNQIGCISTYTSLLGTWIEERALVVIEHKDPVVTVEVHNPYVVTQLENMGAIIR
jgi:hypothetical protein